MRTMRDVLNAYLTRQSKVRRYSFRDLSGKDKRKDDRRKLVNSARLEESDNVGDAHLKHILRCRDDISGAAHTPIMRSRLCDRKIVIINPNR